MNTSGAIAANGEYQTLAALYDKGNKLLIPLAATGTGAGVFTLRLYSTVTSTAYISGIGRFYTDAAGTLGEATSRTLTANALTTLYVRLASGSAYVLVDNASAIPCFGNIYTRYGGPHYAFTEAANAPKISGLDISFLKYCTGIRIYSILNLSVIKGSVSELTNLENLQLIGESIVCTGSAKKLLKKLTDFYIHSDSNKIRIYYETPDYFPTTINRYYLRTNSITNAMADQIFIDLAASPVVASGANRLLAVPSPGGAVSDASLAARNLLKTAERGPFAITVHP